MRTLGAGVLAVLLALQPGAGATARQKPGPAPERFGSQEKILQWIDGYRLEPEPARLPEAVKAMSKLGLLRDQDTAGVHVGFMAGVLGANQLSAEKLVTGMVPMPPEDQAAIVKAIAYSGLPDWKELLGRFVERMPARKVMIDGFLFGKSKLLTDMPLDTGPAPIDTLWGYYFATGGYQPVQRIITALAWAKDKRDVNKLTIGSVAKWTLANNAARDKALLDLCRDEAKVASHPKEVQDALKEVVEAAESFETGRIRKDALAAIEELKRRGPQPDTTWATAAQWGSTAIALGCVVAGATGQVALGLPCIITGALSTAAVKLLSTP